VLSPVFGSVTPKHDFSLPAIIGGSQRCFCSAEPCTTTGCRPKMFMWIADAPDMPAPEAAIVRIMIAASVMPRPEPPTSVGIAMPSQPACANAAWKSCGKPPSRSFVRQ